MLNISRGLWTTYRATLPPAEMWCVLLVPQINWTMLQRKVNTKANCAHVADPNTLILKEYSWGRKSDPRNAHIKLFQRYSIYDSIYGLYMFSYHKYAGPCGRGWACNSKQLMRWSNKWMRNCYNHCRLLNGSHVCSFWGPRNFISPDTLHVREPQ